MLFGAVAGIGGDHRGASRVLGGGGLSTLGVNVVNLAMVPAAVGYPVLLGPQQVLPRRPTRTAIGGVAEGRHSGRSPRCV
ncbi:MAG: energy-coupling factor ABC transporter permease [Pseudonocardiaceae bacterium]